MEGMEWNFLFDWKFYVLAILLGVTYKLGFARKLPLLKSAIVYFVLVLGAIPLYALMLFGLPMIPALGVAVAILLIARFRMKKSA
jgi:hypothetical protein